MKKNLLLCVFCLAGLAAFAQQPVQLTTLLRPPYTLQLSDYYASTQEKLVVVLTNRDLNKPVLQVRLRMSIESQTVQLRTRDYAAFPILSLEAGVPLRLSLSDLAPYFNLENLDFAGISRAEYMMQAKLPEGFYQFCFEAIEVSTSQVASARSCGMAWMSLSDPPLLNVPRKGEAIAQKEPQNIIFQWTPRHLNSPNAAFVTEYDFQLVEFWDNTLAPEVAFQSAQPLYETTTRTTTLLYGPSQPLLLPGHRYGWRVRARVQNGVDASDVFRNQGYSEIYWLTFQDVCPAPTGVSARNGTFGNLEFSWVPNSRHTGYMVTYREKDKDGAVWFDQQSATTSALVYDVQAGKTYEYRVGGFCKTDQPVLGEIHTVTLPARESDNFVNCRIVPDPQITNRTALTVLQQSDVITAGSFPVKLSNVSGSGSFSGRGYVTVPFLGRAKVQVTFENIQVNTDKQLIAGAVITSYNTGEGSVIDIDEGLDIFKGYQGIVSRLQGMTADTDRDDLDKVLDRVVENAEKELPREEADKVKNDAKDLLNAKDTYDKAKDAYNVLPEGDPKKEELKKEVEEAKKNFDEIKSRFDGADKDAVMNDLYTLRFDKLANQTQYGLDAYTTPLDPSDYEKVKQSIDDYYIPWKSVPLGESDRVRAVPINPADPLPDSMFVRSDTGPLTTQKVPPTHYEVKVYGYAEGEINPVIAYEKRKMNGKDVPVARGKLNVVSYPRVYRKLIIVPVNGETMPCTVADVQKRMNEIYRQAVVEWSVEMQPSLTSHYDLDKNGMQDNFDQVNYLYTTEMTLVLQDYAARQPFDPEAHYAFLVSKAETDKASGYNPYKRQAAFIFMHDDAKKNAGDFTHTIAHEIGHGAFRLLHTFEEGLPMNGTDNLMDYAGGETLSKAQWDLIHNPPFMLTLFPKTNVETDGDQPTGVDAPPEVKPEDLIAAKVLMLLKGYQVNIQDFVSGKGVLKDCFESQEKQAAGIERVIDNILADNDTLEAFVQTVKDEVFDLTDESILEGVVCLKVIERFASFDLLVVYNNVQYKDGECIYVTDAEDELALRVVCDVPSVALDAENVTWQGAEGTGTNAVVDMDDTRPDERVVTVAAGPAKAKVTIKTAYIKLTTDKFFAPSEENLDITYDVTPGKSGEWKYAKLEVFAKGGSVPVYVDTKIAAKGKNVKISWDGKTNGSSYSSYIDIVDSPYKVKLTVGMDEKFSTSYSDEKEVGVEVESVTLTPGGALSIVKPDRNAKEILTDVQALVRIRNKKGQGVATALPLTVQWRFEDPDDVANDAKRIIDRNGPEGNDNTSISDGGIAAGWKLPQGSGYGLLTTQEKQWATTAGDGENKGKSLKKFVSSAIAGDNYIVVAEVVGKNASVLKSGRTGIWTVRKNVTNDYVYEMPGSLNMTQVMSKASIDPAFSKDGCTDYTAAKSVVKLAATSAKEFVATLLDPTPEQLPSKADLDAFTTYNKPAQDAAESRMKVKAQAWYDANQRHIDVQLEKFAKDNGIQRPSSVSVRYLHPKHDGDETTGKTNYYPPFILINVGTSTQPISISADGDWGAIDGSEQFNIAWFFKNTAKKGEKRLQIAGRHEIGHRSDHTNFGVFKAGEDHAEEGLMSPSGGMTFFNQIGNPEFSAESINKLRGRER